MSALLRGASATVASTAGSLSRNSAAGGDSRIDECTEVTTARTVDWWTVHQFVIEWLSRVESWPLVGTLEWQRLTDDDARKWASLLDAAQHWALRVEAAQDARAEASRAVAAATDWAAVSSELRQIRDFKAANLWAKRVTS